MPRGIKLKPDPATIGEMLIAKAHEGYRPLPIYYKLRNGDAIVQKLNVNVINTARAVLAARGYGYKPSAAAKTFIKRFVNTGEFPVRFGELLKYLSHLDHEADFNIWFSISETECRKLESKALVFLAAAEAYLKKV